MRRARLDAIQKPWSLKPHNYAQKRRAYFLLRKPIEMNWPKLNLLASLVKMRFVARKQLFLPLFVLPLIAHLYRQPAAD